MGSVALCGGGHGASHRPLPFLAGYCGSQPLGTVASKNNYAGYCLTFMEIVEIHVDRYRCLANGKEFNTISFAQDLSQEWGQKYYVTEDGEAAIVDLINAKPEGMVDLDSYVELLWIQSGWTNCLTVPRTCNKQLGASLLTCHIIISYGILSV